jgi:hypothetical protein
MPDQQRPFAGSLHLDCDRRSIQASFQLANALRRCLDQRPGEFLIIAVATPLIGSLKCRSRDSVGWSTVLYTSWTMRVQPDLLGNPLTVLRSESPGLPSWACLGANNPGAPLRKIKISVVIVPLGDCATVLHSYGRLLQTSVLSPEPSLSDVGPYYTMLGSARQSSYGSNRQLQ